MDCEPLTLDSDFITGTISALALTKAAFGATWGVACTSIAVQVPYDTLEMTHETLLWLCVSG